MVELLSGLSESAALSEITYAVFNSPKKGGISRMSDVWLLVAILTIELSFAPQDSLNNAAAF